MSDNAPVVGCVIVRVHVGEQETLLGRYSETHAKEYLRGLVTGPGGKLERLPPVCRTYDQAGSTWCFDCGLKLPSGRKSVSGEKLVCSASKPYETSIEAALREAREETGARPGDLRPVASETFRARVYGHGYEDGVEVHAVLLEALPYFDPRDQPGEAGKVGGWRWYPTSRLPSVLRLSPLAAMCAARFGLR